MTPAQRAYAISWAKSLATPVVSCVQARLSPAHLLGRCARVDLEALVVILAEAADPAVLRAVVTVRDDGRPDLSRRDAMLRKAHTEVVQLRKKRLPVPVRLRRLDNAYRLQRKQAEQQRGEDARDAAA